MAQPEGASVTQLIQIMSAMRLQRYVQLVSETQRGMP
jgi:hypothetical protein